MAELNLDVTRLEFKYHCIAVEDKSEVNYWYAEYVN